MNHPIYEATAALTPSYPGGGVWVTTADTARLIRSALKAAFPDTKFSVRSRTYAGGSSIDVSYDGVVMNDDPSRPWPVSVLVDYDGNVIDPTPVDSPDYRTGRYGSLPKPGAPLKRDVQAVVAAFGSKDFDGSIDMQYSKRAWLLPDGTASWADSPGSAGSGGYDPGFNFPAPVPGAVRVNFGAGYIFVRDDGR